MDFMVNREDIESIIYGTLLRKRYVKSKYVKDSTRTTQHRGLFPSSIQLTIVKSQDYIS